MGDVDCIFGGVMDHLEGKELEMHWGHSFFGRCTYGQSKFTIALWVSVLPQFQGIPLDLIVWNWKEVTYLIWVFHFQGILFLEFLFLYLVLCRQALLGVVLFMFSYFWFLCLLLAFQYISLNWLNLSMNVNIHNNNNNNPSSLLN